MNRSTASNSGQRKAYSPRPPYSTHFQQVEVASISRSRSISPLNVSDIEGSAPGYLKRLAKPTRDILNVADIPGATSQHCKFRSKRAYNNPADPVYYWGDGLCGIRSGGVLVMKNQKKVPRHLLSMFRGHDSHSTQDIEGARPANKMLSYAEKVKGRVAGEKSPIGAALNKREKDVFPVTPLAGFLMDVHRTLGRPPVCCLRRRNLTPVPSLKPSL